MEVHKHHGKPALKLRGWATDDKYLIKPIPTSPKQSYFGNCFGEINQFSMPMRRLCVSMQAMPPFGNSRQLGCDMDINLQTRSLMVGMWPTTNTSSRFAGKAANHGKNCDDSLRIGSAICTRTSDWSCSATMRAVSKARTRGLL